MSRASRLMRALDADRKRDGAEEWARREREAAAGQQAHAEALERFSPLTADNAQEALDWQEARVQELLAEG